MYCLDMVNVKLQENQCVKMFAVIWCITVGLATQSLGFVVEIRTDPSNFAFLPATSNVINFGIQTDGCADILLSESPTLPCPNYRISLGCSYDNRNTQWVQIAKNEDIRMEVAVQTDLLNNVQLHNFTICWDDSGYVAVGRSGDWYPLLFWKDTDPSEAIPNITYVGIRTKVKSSYGYDRTIRNGLGIYYSYPGKWIVEAAPRMDFLDALISNFHPTNNSILIALSKSYERMISTPVTTMVSELQTATAGGEIETSSSDNM